MNEEKTIDEILKHHAWGVLVTIADRMYVGKGVAAYYRNSTGHGPKKREVNGVLVCVYPANFHKHIAGMFKQFQFKRDEFTLYGKRKKKKRKTKAVQAEPLAQEVPKIKRKRARIVKKTVKAELVTRSMSDR